MLDVKLDENLNIARLMPSGPLAVADFEAAAKQIDPLIEKRGKLAGLLIYTEHFPGWESFGAMAQHFKFIRDHHRHVKRIAFVTDSSIGDIAKHLGSHFISAEIRTFSYSELEAAEHWLSQSSLPDTTATD